MYISDGSDRSWVIVHSLHSWWSSDRGRGRKNNLLNYSTNIWAPDRVRHAQKMKKKSRWGSDQCNTCSILHMMLSCFTVLISECVSLSLFHPHSPPVLYFQAGIPRHLSTTNQQTFPCMIFMVMKIMSTPLHSKPYSQWERAERLPKAFLRLAEKLLLSRESLCLSVLLIVTHTKRNTHSGD